MIHTLKHIILDCDPGHDDAINIIIATANSDIFNVLGITTVGGNVEVEKNTLNALKVLELLNSDIPVYKGQSRPLVKEIEIATEIHGDSGMDGPILPEPNRKEEVLHAVDFIIETVKNSKEKVTLVPTGPLTNIAMALIKDPSIKNNIEEIVLMGGGTFGNWTPAAEFNVFVDAEAAKVVFTSGIPLAVFGLDVTHQVIATDDIVDRVGEIDNEVAEFVKELLIFFGQTYKDFFGINGGPIHDACTCMYLLNPDMFTMEEVNITIETKGEATYGMTVVDLLKTTGKKVNAKFATGVDQERFWDTFMDTLTLFNK